MSEDPSCMMYLGAVVDNEPFDFIIYSFCTNFVIIFCPLWIQNMRFGIILACIQTINQMRWVTKICVGFFSCSTYIKEQSASSRHPQDKKPEVSLELHFFSSKVQSINHWTQEKCLSKYSFLKKMSINLTTYAPIVQVCWKHFRQKTWFRSFFKIIIISKLKILKYI